MSIPRRVTTDYDWEEFGYRVIPEWPGYVMSAELNVWSLSRQVRCKGSATRQTAARQIKLIDGRVSLSQDGKTARYHVHRELYPVVFPELACRPQAWCARRGARNLDGHPLRPLRPDLPGVIARRIGEPKVALWGTGNRICLWCYDPPETFPDDNAYSLHFGVAGMPEYTSAPVRARLREGDRFQLAELDWGEHGFIISNSPW